MALDLGSPGALAGGAVEPAAFLVIGFLSGVHCLGMCGPLVTVYADRVRAQQGADDETLTLHQVRQQLLLNLGRVAGYALVGGLLAGLGAATVGGLGALPAVGGAVRGATGILAGGLIMATGLAYARGSSTHPTAPGLVRLYHRVRGFLTRRVDALVGDARIAGLGATHALLPCPITYPAYIYAFAVADPLRGAALLGLLGLGTFPAVLASGTLLTSASASPRLHRALGLVFVALGYVPLSQGLVAVGLDAPRIPLPMPSLAGTG